MTSRGSDGRSWRRWVVVLVFALVVLGGLGGIGIYVLQRDNGPGQVEVVNQPTKASEPRPLTTETDPQFTPPPLEREGHDE